jgi:hypothetical protein
MTVQTKAIQYQYLGKCCPVFQPETWDEKVFHWDQKRFIKASMPTLFHVPLPGLIGKRIGRLVQQAEAYQALPEEKEEILMLFHDPHAFKSELFLTVTDEVPPAKNTTLSGTFVSKVFDGAYQDIPRFFKEMEAYLEEGGKSAKDYYVHYAYCPKCAEEAGHNYMVIFAEVD